MGIAKLFGPAGLAARWNMRISASMPRLKGFRHPREIIAYAVWVYHRFALSTADVEDLLAERGVIVSRETIRLWVNRSARISPTVLVAIGQVPRTSGISTRW